LVERLLSIKEFAERLGGVSPATVATWLSTGRFGLERTKVGSRTMLAETELLKCVRREGVRPSPRKRDGDAA
jgi:hypothetical protein